MNAAAIQADFDKMLSLLSKQADGNIFVKELLVYYTHNELRYSTWKDTGIANRPTKQHLIRIYEDRAGLEHYLRPENHFVVGYEQLIPAMYETVSEEICISNIYTKIGTFLIFSDYEFSNYIGILKSKRTLSDIRDTYLLHKRQVEEMGEKLQYEYSEEGKIFKGGKLVD